MADEVTPAPKKRGRKPKIHADLEAAKAAPKKYPRIDVLERRLRNPGRDATLPTIELRDQPEPMRTRWVNSGEDGRFSEVTGVKGWEPVRFEEVVNVRSIGGARKSEEGFFVRGRHGEEVLCKIPVYYYDKIKMAEADRRNRRSQSASQTKEKVTEKVAQQFGDEGADRFQKLVGSIDTHVERQPLE
jgi:hypothetical protein